MRHLPPIASTGWLVQSSSLILAMLVLPTVAVCQEIRPSLFSDELDPRCRLQTMLVGTLQLPDEQFLQFAERVKPDVVVMGAFGAPQWSAQENPRRWLDQWRAVFLRMARKNIKVVGTIELLNVGNSPAEAAKFADFFDNRWDTTLLGAKPAVSAAELLENRSMPAEEQVGAHAPRGCAVNPHGRAVAKAFVKAVIDAGIDGFITHRNMFGECGCPFCHAQLDSSNTEHVNSKRQRGRGSAEMSDAACQYCREGFRGWLAARYDVGELQRRFRIGDLATHRLTAIYGHHREHERLPSPIELEGMKYARHAIKDCFDDVFVLFGRSLKRDLIVAQWNHMPYFDELHLDQGHIPPWHVTTFAHASADERWSLPIDLWGRGEDFYWYCNWGTCQNTQLDKHFLGDVTLYAKLLRGLARGKPYVINKYDFYRPRNMMAEAAALGMIAGAKDVPYRAAEDARVMARYFDFLKQHRDLYRGSNGHSVADVLLVLPRTALHAGEAAELEMIEVAGRTMINDHIQFDIVPDDLFESTRGYRVVVMAECSRLNDSKLTELKRRQSVVIAIPPSAKQADDLQWRDLNAVVVREIQPHSGGTAAAEPFRAALRKALEDKHAQFDAPYTVEAHVYRQDGKYVVHLVNYNHKEKAAGRSVVEREAPVAADPVGVRLPIPEPAQVVGITFLDPDAPSERKLKFEQTDGQVIFRTPSLLVYGVCVIETR